MDACEACKEIATFDLIFFEYYKDDPRKKTVDDPGVILTFGRNFRYWFAYQDALLWENILEPKYRKECFFLENENRKDEEAHRMESQLTPRRRLFGFVVNEHKGTKPPHKDWKPALDALAGRVHFNWATYANGGKEAKDVVLKILGQPRASAFEMYLQQDEKAPLNTYGDPALSDRRGKLRGRKRYVHNLAAKDAPKVYTMEKNEKNSQNSTAKVLLCPEGDNLPTFKFSVRFENLDDYELGLLIFALDLGNDPVNAPTRYHKLGHGQPIGLGSVTIDVDDIKLLAWRDGKFQFCEADDKRGTWKEAWGTKFASWFGKEHRDDGFWASFKGLEQVKALDSLLRPVLDECGMVADDCGMVKDDCGMVKRSAAMLQGAVIPQVDYPRLSGEIVKYHGEVRKEHGQARRRGERGKRTNVPILCKAEEIRDPKKFLP